MKIYPCITTLTKNNWQKQIRDLGRNHLTEAAVFLTGIKRPERLKLYSTLKKSTLKYVPHVHLRHDMTKDEFDFFFNNYQTRQFNTHVNFLDQLERLPDYLKYCLIETTSYFDYRLVKEVSGYCLDLAHLYDKKLCNLTLLSQVSKLMKQKTYPKANHISGFKKNNLSSHFITSIDDFDYLLKFKSHYFSKTVCLELENSIDEQLNFIKYIGKLLP